MFKKISLGLMILTNSSQGFSAEFSEDIYVKLAAKSACLYKQGKGSDIKVYEREMTDFGKKIEGEGFSINKFKSDQILYSSDKGFMNRRLNDMMKMMNSCHLLELKKEKIDNGFLSIPIVKNSVVMNKVNGKNGLPSVMELEVKKNINDIVLFYAKSLAKYKPKKTNVDETIILEFSVNTKKRMVTLEPRFNTTYITIIGE
ncbi:hypothetical protein ACM9HF_02970 [Colwellia sp. RE-S-Sl-9]